ncbi:hypothetical protein [Streptomyces sp. A1-5]|uniref:hypothetical protein n=1 Tax=Streptomyces sp. A1-5 TaxID=2738410 RepID=UPI001F48EA22|nr:hypothetical protein [Streptomyces sp. A1-5]UJB46188.1 hypothetical protein HRD51_40480 [Streptomyces sp. A1-5]
MQERNGDGVHPHPRIALASTEQAELAAAQKMVGHDALVEQPSTHAKAVDAVSAALQAAFCALPRPRQDTTPLYVLCDDYSVLAARRLAARCLDPHRRLRPSDSVQAETSELVRPYLSRAGHRGNCYLLARMPVAAALRLTGRHTPADAVLCEIVPLPTEDPLAPNCLAVAAVWGAETSGAFAPEAHRTPSSLLAALSQEG